MVSVSGERTRLLVKISKLYYLEGLNQQEIAENLNISRPQVSRMITEARNIGIVNITITDPFLNESQYEELLVRAFGLKEVLVVSPNQDIPANAALGNAAAELLERHMKDGCIIGVNAGISLSYVSSSANKTNKKNISVVPLVAGWGPNGEKWQANLSVKTLAENLGCEYLQLNAPAFVSSKEIRDALTSESEISFVLEMAKQTSIALVGIGGISADATLMKTNFLTDEHLSELRAKGAVANICNSFINDKGEYIDFSGYDNMIGLRVEDLNNATDIIGVAAGKDKVEAIHAALQGGRLDRLVTDLTTAKMIADRFIKI